MLFFFFSYSLTSFSKTSANPFVTPAIASLTPSVSIYLSAIALAIIGAICFVNVDAFFSVFFK